MDLQTTLHGTAADMPPVNTERLWERGRRLRRRRRFRTVAVVLILLASVVLAPRLFTDTSLPIGDDTGEPGSLGKPYWWQQSFSQNPNGPAAAVFSHGGTYTMESAGVVVGLDDSYRLIELNPGEELGLISPDGRYLARGSELIHLQSDHPIKIAPDAEEFASVFPLAWSADSTQLLFVVDRDMRVPANPVDTDQVRVFELAAKTSRTIHTTSTDFLTTSAAFSPGGSHVALSSTGSLILIDVKYGGTSDPIPLEPDQELAGQAAWTPDGKQIALTVIESCGRGDCGELASWRLLFLNPDTEVAKPGGRRRGTPEKLTGWRNGEPVFTGYLNGRNSLFVAKPDGSAEVLLALAEGGGRLDVPRDRVERGSLQGDVRANPLAAQPWAYAVVLLTLLMVGWPITLIVRRIRRRRSRSRGRT